MYLSRLQLYGFKSFAQKTKLDFSEGITCVIGPNGSGKSNIVDAIRWVLGEQRVSTLRSDKMENVIFNGTKNRKPVGMAEISITIENNKNILNTEFDEVVISRRLYRSGDSQYLINKTPVRLKDVLNLFMDTGLGANSYSVIELKMIESILSENKSERRQLFGDGAVNVPGRAISPGKEQQVYPQPRHLAGGGYGILRRRPAQPGRANDHRGKSARSGRVRPHLAGAGDKLEPACRFEPFQRLNGPLLRAGHSAQRQRPPLYLCAVAALESHPAAQPGDGVDDQA